MNDHPVLQCIGVWKGYATSSVQVQVLQDFSLALQRAEIVALVGASGCGKTTVLRLIAGLDSVDSGAILAQDKQVSNPGPDRVLMFQDDTLLPWKTVFDNVLIRRKSDHFLALRARELLGVLHVDALSERWPHQISGGERRRVELARALMFQPSALLLDEPLSSLDAFTRLDLVRELGSIWRQNHQTVLFATHDLTEAALLADRVVVLGKRAHKIISTESIDLPFPRQLGAVSAIVDRLRLAISGVEGGSLQPPQTPT